MDSTGTDTYESQHKVDVYPFLISVVQHRQLEHEIQCEHGGIKKRGGRLPYRIYYKKLLALDTTNLDRLLRAFTAASVTSAQKTWNRYLRTMVKELWLTPRPEPFVKVAMRHWATANGGWGIIDSGVTRTSV